MAERDYGLILVGANVVVRIPGVGIVTMTRTQWNQRVAAAAADLWEELSSTVERTAEEPR